MVRIIRYFSLFIYIMMLWGCTDHDDLRGGTTNQEYPVNIILSSNYLVDSFDKALTEQNIQLYYFRKNSNNEYLFAHASTPPDLKVSSINNQIQIETTLPFKKGDQIKYVVLTDYQGASPKIGQSFDDLNQTLTYGLSGKWTKADAIPMSGTGYLEIASQSTKSSVVLIRSLAAVQVLIDSQNQVGKYKFSTLKSVRVYRTKNKVVQHIPSDNLSSDGIVTKPTEADGALYNIGDNSGTSDIAKAEQHPLIYEMPASSTSSKNEIFIPERYHAPSDAVDKVVAMVIGVTYDDDPKKEYFHRIDFGFYESETTRSPLPFYSILRNFRYTFMLQGADEPGYSLPEDALAAKASVWVDVFKWNTEETDSDLNGQYYFSMERSTVHLNEDENAKETLPFETNIPKGDLNSAITLSWGPNQNKESEYFNASLDEENSVIVITSKQKNTSSNPYTDNLIVTVLNQKFKVKVEQGEKLPDYMISQKHYEVNGIYVHGRELDQSNYITLRLYAREKNSVLNGATYHLVAHEVEGIRVDHKGVFQNLKTDAELGLKYEDITVPVIGKSNQARDKILSIVANSYQNSFLNVDIPFALTSKVVLDFRGVNARASGTENLNKLLNSDDFSLKPNAKVNIENVSLITSTSTDMQAEINRVNPDVIIIRNGYPVGNQHFEAMSNFLMKRNKHRASNSIIALTSRKEMVDFMMQKNIIPNGTLTSVKKVGENANQDLEYFEITPTKSGVNLKYRYQIPTYALNIVATGPFGNIGGHFIALSEDSYYLHKLSNTDIYKYSGATPYAIKDIKIDFGMSAFRTENYNLFWMGSDNFIDSEQDNWMFNNNGQIIDYNPDEYTYTYLNPDIPKSEILEMVLSSNGIFFANTLYWALYNSEYIASKIQ